MNKTDFVIPLHRNNLLFRCTIEAIVLYYHPKTIHIITPAKEIQNLCIDIEKESWVLGNSQLCFWDEESFFMKSSYGLTKEIIESWYCHIDEQSREFGWWFQQIIKLGALSCIKELSDPFMVWDSDLIPLEPWSIYPCIENDDNYTFALLQEKEKNEFNKTQYSQSLFSLLGLMEICPRVGTFVPHHFVFHHCVIREFIERIEKRNLGNCCWIESIMKLSHEYYRFSEYKSIATFMSVFYPNLLCYHFFENYGKKGLRIRDESEAQNLVKHFLKFVGNDRDGNYSYFCLMEFLDDFYAGTEISYLQVEHL